MIDNTNKMKCCPFCGELHRLKIWDTGFGIARIIECKNCQTLFVSQWKYATQELIDRWNRRCNQTDTNTDTYLCDPSKNKNCIKTNCLKTAENAMKLCTESLQRRQTEEEIKKNERHENL